jgi:hypothetical protein
MPTKGFYVNLLTPTGKERWRVAERRMKDWALVEWETRTIWVRPKQTNAELADTLIHESAHIRTGIGSDPTVEDVIEGVAANATALLLKAELLIGEDD